MPAKSLRICVLSGRFPLGKICATVNEYKQEVLPEGRASVALMFQRAYMLKVRDQETGSQEATTKHNIQHNMKHRVRRKNMTSRPTRKNIKEDWCGSDRFVVDLAVNRYSAVIFPKITNN